LPRLAKRKASNRSTGSLVAVHATEAISALTSTARRSFSVP
jgi:hypothetical protein